MFLHYLGKQETRNLRAFTRMLHGFYYKHTKHTKKYHLTQLNNPSLSKQSTVCTRQNLGTEHSILQYVTVMLDVYQ